MVQENVSRVSNSLHLFCFCGLLLGFKFANIQYFPHAPFARLIGSLIRL